MCRKPAAAMATKASAEQAQHEVSEKIHMDLTSDTGHLPVRDIIQRAALVLRLSDRLHGASWR